MYAYFLTDMLIGNLKITIDKYYVNLMKKCVMQLEANFNIFPMLRVCLCEREN